MTGVVIYRSKYGSSKKYAEWISESTGFDCFSVDGFKIDSLDKYDTVIVTGGVYATGISCTSFLKKIINKIEGKKVAVFTCAASPYDEVFFNELVAKNMKDELSDIPVFYGRGGFDMKNMSFADRTLCKILRKAVGKKDPKDYEVWEKALMEVAEDEAGDWTDKSYIEPLLDYLKAA